MQDLSEQDTPSSSVLSLLQVVQDLEHHSKKSHHGTHHGQDLDDHKMKSHHGTHHSLPSAGIKQLQRKRHHEKQHHASYQHHLPEGLSIRSEPSEKASLIGTLNKGAIFKVSAAHESSDGKVWLQLSDGHGWVPREQVAEIQQDPKPSEAPKETKAKEAPAKSQEAIREEYKKLPMKEKDLPDQLEHNHGKTINGDWRNEYPYKHDPAKPTQEALFGSAPHQSYAVAVSLSFLVVVAA